MILEFQGRYEVTYFFKRFDTWIHIQSTEYGFSNFYIRLAHTSLKSVEVPPRIEYPPDLGSLGGVMLFALTFFLIHQISSEKLQNVANTLKILCKIFGNGSYDAWFRKSFFQKIMSSFWQEFQDINFEKRKKNWFIQPGEARNFFGHVQTTKKVTWLNKIIVCRK